MCLINSFNTLDLYSFKVAYRSFLLCFDTIKEASKYNITSNNLLEYHSSHRHWGDSIALKHLLKNDSPYNQNVTEREMCDLSTVCMYVVGDILFCVSN